MLIDWSENLYTWTLASKHQARFQIFLHLKDSLEELKCISLEDKDNFTYSETTANLSVNNQKESGEYSALLDLHREVQYSVKLKIVAEIEAGDLRYKPQPKGRDFLLGQPKRLGNHLSWYYLDQTTPPKTSYPYYIGTPARFCSFSAIPSFLGQTSSSYCVTIYPLFEDRFRI